MLAPHAMLGRVRWAKNNVRALHTKNPDSRVAQTDTLTNNKTTLGTLDDLIGASPATNVQLPRPLLLSSPPPYLLTVRMFAPGIAKTFETTRSQDEIKEVSREV